MFVPQVLTAIATSLLSRSRPATHLQASPLLFLTANLTSIFLLLLIHAFECYSSVYPLLLVATSFLGACFVLTFPLLNTYFASFLPERPDKTFLVLNSLLMLSTSLTPYSSLILRATFS